ncbi:MAG TPA: hypothetical protein VFL62_12020 [Bradyrhizobium sp.]|uniref:hypothetical protein n=1 Tax=Bradyrhizobium sp. TaxID=376 RepID=UPI002D80EA98|nr:hypothetical protein [Bradyrhizobium sp.]HET7886944.1 hypothetical protein [Bradyrhizobium sp.]
MVAISLDAAGLFRRQKGALGTVRENDRDQGQTRRKPDLAMSRTDATMVLRFALIVSHAWVTLTARVQYPNIRLNLNGLAVADWRCGRKVERRLSRSSPNDANAHRIFISASASRRREAEAMLTADMTRAR